MFRGGAFDSCGLWSVSSVDRSTNWMDCWELVETVGKESSRRKWVTRHSICMAPSYSSLSLLLLPCPSSCFSCGEHLCSPTTSPLKMLYLIKLPEVTEPVTTNENSWNCEPKINLSSFTLMSYFFTATESLLAWEKNSLFNKWHCENWISTYKRIKLDLYKKSTQNELKI